MMQSITFEVPGRPVPKGRPRVTANGTFTPAKTRRYQDQVRMAALAAGASRFYTEGPVGMEITATHTSRRGLPDLDNVVKGVADALQVPKKLRKDRPPACALYRDDSQICELLVRRVIHREGASGLRVTITRLPEGADLYRGSE